MLIALSSRLGFYVLAGVFLPSGTINIWIPVFVTLGFLCCAWRFFVPWSLCRGTTTVVIPRCVSTLTFIVSGVFFVLCRRAWVSISRLAFVFPLVTQLHRGTYI